MISGAERLERWSGCNIAQRGQEESLIYLLTSIYVSFLLARHYTRLGEFRREWNHNTIYSHTIVNVH